MWWPRLDRTNDLYCRMDLHLFEPLLLSVSPGLWLFNRSSYHDANRHSAKYIRFCYIHSNPLRTMGHRCQWAIYHVPRPVGNVKRLLGL